MSAKITGCTRIRCPKCSNFMRKYHIYRHMRLVHNCPDEEIKGFKVEVRRYQMRQRERARECDKCGNFFVDFDRHLNRCPAIEEKVVKERKNRVQCPVCSVAVWSLLDLGSHCAQVHVDDNGTGESQDYRIFTYTFSKEEDLQEWLVWANEYSQSRFVTYKSVDARVYMRCYRSGRYCKKGTLRQRASRIAVTHCPAHIVISRNMSGEIEARAVLGHAGHDLKYESVTEKKRREKVGIMEPENKPEGVSGSPEPSEYQCLVDSETLSDDEEEGGNGESSCDDSEPKFEADEKTVEQHLEILHENISAIYDLGESCSKRPQGPHILERINEETKKFVKKMKQMLEEKNCGLNTDSEASSSTRISAEPSDGALALEELEEAEERETNADEQCFSSVSRSPAPTRTKRTIKALRSEDYVYT